MKWIKLTMLAALLFCFAAMNAQPRSITPTDYQKMLGRGLDVDWWGRSEKNKQGDYTELAVAKFARQGVQHIRIRMHHLPFAINADKEFYDYATDQWKEAYMPLMEKIFGKDTSCQ